MNFYDAKEIKRVADCAGVLEGILDEVRQPNGRYNCPWRTGSDSASFVVNGVTWYDHVAKEGADVFELVKRARGVDFAGACEILGDYYGLSASVQKQQRRRMVARYIYRDVEGNPVHATVRYDPKDFRQERYDEDSGEWVPGLDGVETVPYNLPGIVNAETVLLCEGERDADAARDKLSRHATTLPMGAGKWSPRYAKWFRGKTVVLCPDGDDAGRMHMRNISKFLDGVAAKTITVRDWPEGEDLSDWIKNGGNEGEFDKLLVQVLAEETKPRMERAKQANVQPLRNYVFVTEMKGGREKMVKVPRKIQKIVDDIHERFLGFPARVGTELFDYDLDKQEIRYLNRPADLFAWMAEKSGQNVLWSSRLEGRVSRDELFSVLYAQGKRYTGISDTQTFPKRAGLYYTCPDLPEPDLELEYFENFVDFFCPASDEDRYLLKMFIASCLYYKPKIQRPLWIIDSEAGQGVGKTRLVEMVATLFGCPEDPESQTPIWCDQSMLTNEYQVDRIAKRILSKTGRRKRILAIDNVSGFFRAPALAGLITQDAIAGMAPYGHGEETRPNDLTYVCTVNSASLDRDLISRAFFIELTRPKRSSTWEQDVLEYIEEYRYHIIADLISLMNPDTAPFACDPVTRFGTWERDIAVNLCPSLAVYSDVFKTNEDRKGAADGEKEENEIIYEHLQKCIREQGAKPGKEICFISTAVLIKWVHEVLPSYGGKSGRNLKHHLRNAIKAGEIPALSEEVKRYPRNGNKQVRGMIWNHDLYAERVAIGETPVVHLYELDADRQYVKERL